jgi:DNA-binding MarR family transcriptional regulator
MWYGAGMESESPLERALVAQWRELVARKTRIWNALDTELDKRHGLSASEFEVMDQLAEYELGYEPRVQELALHCPVTQSALSRMIGRLEGQNLVFRKLCDADRRGVFVGLTPEGQVRLQEARRTHRTVLAAELGDQVKISDTVDA